MNRFSFVLAIALVIFIPSRGAFGQDCPDGCECERVQCDPPCDDNVYYVDNMVGVTEPTGHCWMEAFASLQEALDVVPEGAVVKVAGCESGRRYYAGLPTERDESFVLKNGVRIEGGYAGALLLCSCERNPGKFITILTGDLGVEDENNPNDMPYDPVFVECLDHFVGDSCDWECDPCCGLDADLDGVITEADLQKDDNSYHVIKAVGAGSGAVVDGFIIEGGYASGTEIGQKRGAAIYIEYASPTFANCIIHDNHAMGGGGAVYVGEGGTAVFDRCLMMHNRAVVRGGAVFSNLGWSPVFRSCRLINNLATYKGGAIASIDTAGQLEIINSLLAGNRVLDAAGGKGGAVCHTCPAKFINCTVVANEAAVSGGGIFNDAEAADSLTVINSILWGNVDSGGIDESAQIHSVNGTPDIKYSCIEGCLSGTGGFCESGLDHHNDGDDPLFVDLVLASGAIELGDHQLKLRNGSPSIDAGNNADVPPEVMYDIEGEDIEGGEPNRFLGVDLDEDGTAEVDRGAFEMPAAGDGCSDAEFESRCWFDKDISGLNHVGNGGYRLHTSLARGATPRTFAPRKVDPLLSSSPLVSRESAHLLGPNPYPERPTQRDIFDLITGKPLLQEVDFELPFGGAVFRHVRTYGAWNRPVTCIPSATHGGACTAVFDYDDTDQEADMWDWNGLFWMMGENPLLLIDARYRRLIYDGQPDTRWCYLIPDAHHSIPFIYNEGKYVAPDGFDALMDHSEEFVNDVPTEFYVWLHRRSIKYTFQTQAEDAWPALPPCEHLTVHAPGPDGGPDGCGDNCCDDDYDQCYKYFWGIPYYGLLKTIEDRYGNRAEITYCDFYQSPKGEDSEQQLETCRQNCTEKGQIKYITLNTADGQIPWTLVYVHRSFADSYDTGVWQEPGELRTNHMVHAIYVYEGDVSSQLPDGCYTIPGAAFCSGTLEESEALEYEGLPESWRIKVQYLYSERSAGCCVIEDYKQAVPQGAQGTVSPYRLLKTTVVRRGEEEGVSNSETVYRYGGHFYPADGDAQTSWPTHLKTIYSNRTIDGIKQAYLAKDPPEVVETNDLLAWGDTKAVPYLDPETGEVAEREFEEVADVLLDYGYTAFCADFCMTDFTTDLMNFIGIGLEAVRTLCAYSGYHRLVDRRPGQEKGNFVFHYFKVMPTGAPESYSEEYCGGGGPPPPFQNKFEHVYHYPHHVGIYDDDEDDVIPPGDEKFFVTVIDEMPTLSDEGYSIENYHVRSRRVVEMNPRGFILRDRTWKATEDGEDLVLDSQHGFSEVFRYDADGRMIERRTAGWDSPENPDQATNGFVYFYEYKENQEEDDIDVLSAVGIQRGACDEDGCTDPTVYYLEAYEHNNLDRPDLMTLAVKFPIPAISKTDPGGIETRWDYELYPATGDNGWEKAIKQKAEIGPPGVELTEGTERRPIQKALYNENGNEIASGAGYIDSGSVEVPFEGGSLTHRFQSNYTEYDNQGRPTLQIVDVDSTAAPPDFPDDYARIIPDGIYNPPLNLTTTYDYDPIYGLRHVSFPNGKESYIYYVEDAYDPSILDQWIYKDVLKKPGADETILLSQVELNHFESGQLRWKKTIKLPELDHYPPWETETYTEEDVLSTVFPEYDENGRIIGVEQQADDVDPIKAEILYDSYGQIWRQKGPDGTLTRYVYDQLGRLSGVYRGTRDNHEYWNRGLTCADLWEWDEGDGDCSLPGCFDDDLVLLERRFYGKGVTNANELTGIWTFRQQPQNQYFETGIEDQGTTDCQPPGDNNESDIGWLAWHEYDWRMRPAKVTQYTPPVTLDENGVPTDDPIHCSLTWFDHLDRVLLTAEYGGAPPIDAAYDPTLIDPGESSEPFVDDVITHIFSRPLNDRPLSLSRSIYNARGLIEETRQYDVQASGDIYTSTRTYYNHLGQEAAVYSNNSPVRRYEYDAKGRQILSWSEVGGTQLTLTKTTFDENDRAIFIERYERKPDATGDNLDASNSIVSYSYTWYDKAGKIIARADFGTNADTFFAEGTTAPLPLDGEACTQPCYDPGVPPETVDAYDDVFPDVQITLYGYDDAGRQITVTDPGGITTKTDYDGLGRVIMVTENYVVEPAVAGDRFTAYKYGDRCVQWDGETCVEHQDTNLLAKIAAVMPEYFGGADPSYDLINWDSSSEYIQITEYVYGADVVQDDGEGYAAKSANFGWIKEVHYPDPDTGAPEADPSITFTYRSDGKVVQRTDARGVELVYAYDEFDRLESITADIPGGSTVDATADAMIFDYTLDGLLFDATVKDAAEQTLATAHFDYGGFQQLTSATQSLTTPDSEKSVAFDWDADATADYFRLSSITYPSEIGLTLGLNYGTPSSVDDLLSRLTSYDTGDPGTPLVSYRHMGESHRVGMSYRNGISRDYDYDVDSDGTVDGLDAFGRVTDISFEHDVNGQALYYQYGYDKRGNKQFARVEHQGADRSWLYEYDDLNRLVRASRGELNAAGDGFIGSTPETTRWYLDPLGNWSDGDGDRSVIWFDDADGDGQWDEDADGTWDQDDDPLCQSVHHDSNSVNQIESRIEGDGGGTEPPIDFAYDAAGNLTFDGRQYYVYDAWNRLVAVYEPGTLTVDQNGDLQGIPGPCISRYQYDALNRRVQTIEHPGKVIEHKTMHVYGGGAQVLAEYDVTEGEAGPLARWFAHGESFPDPLVMVDLTAAGDEPAGISEYLYYLKDALGSVGALANEAGEVVERYIYDPYGNTTVLRPDGTSGLPAMPESYYFDADLDLTITLADYDHLLACSATPGDPICVFAHDYNRSGTVDGDDVGTFEAFLNDLPMPAPEPWRREVRVKLDADGALAGSGASVPILDLFDFDGLEICFAAPDALCLQLYDIDNDGTLTLSDEYAAFVSYFTGPDPTDAPPDGGSRFDNTFLWTGQRYEPATGLYHFLYRTYDPVLGRWLQRDPLGVLATAGGLPGRLSSNAPQSMNLAAVAYGEYRDGNSLYQYVASNPLTLCDPDGRALYLKQVARASLSAGLIGGVVGGFFNMLNDSFSDKSEGWATSFGKGFAAGFIGGAIGGGTAAFAVSAAGLAGTTFGAGLEFVLANGVSGGISSGTLAKLNGRSWAQAGAEALFGALVSSVVPLGYAMGGGARTMATTSVRNLTPELVDLVFEVAGVTGGALGGAFGVWAQGVLENLGYTLTFEDIEDLERRQYLERNR